MHLLKAAGTRLLMAVGSMGLYAALFLAFYAHLDLYTAALNAIPAALCGALLGVRGGLLYLLLGLPTNLLLFNLVQSPNNELITHFFGLSAFTILSLGIGWVRDLRLLNARISKQAIELATERKLLQEEIVRRMHAEEKLAYEALHDPLTDLPNRRLFFKRLEHAHALSKQNPNSLCAVLYLDLDQFKAINDGMGHEAGDALLQQVADRLQSSVRVADTVARMGGDEFAILLEAVPSTQEIKAMIRQIQENLARPYDLQGRTIVSHASIGVVMNIAPYHQIDTIVRDADTAMYGAKGSHDRQSSVVEAAQYPTTYWPKPQGQLVAL